MFRNSYWNWAETEAGARPTSHALPPTPNVPSLPTLYFPYVWKAATLTQKGNTPAVELLHENSFHGNDCSPIQPNSWRVGYFQFLFQSFNILTISIHSFSHSFIESLIGVRYCSRLWWENGETELAHFLCSVKLSVYLNKIKKSQI